MALHVLKRLQGCGELAIYLMISILGLFQVGWDYFTGKIKWEDIDTSQKRSGRIFGKTWPRVNSMIYKKELETELPSMVASASGIVVELGPGTGNQLGRYDKSKVTKIYGVEPNHDLHNDLRANIKAHGLMDIYNIVPCGIEDIDCLRKYGLTDGSVDTVLTVQVMCSVPEPKQIVKRLYALLKPGATMIVYEHSRSADPITRTVQSTYDRVWPYLMGNCHLTRPTGDYILAAGNWATVDVKLPEQDEPWLAIPHFSGKLVKAK